MADFDLSYACGLAPKDAIQYFESKGLAVSFRWQDVWQEAHARAFTVAGVTKLDVLKDIQKVTADAIAKGYTQSQFVSLLKGELAKKGWWGEKEIVHPKTGEVRTIKMTPHRLKLIYTQNTQSAYMAGRYKQQMGNAKNQPFWRYVTKDDPRTRREHKRLHGKVFRHDDPFWESHYPPNGWGCRCRIDAYDAEELAHYHPEARPESSHGRMVKKDVTIKNSTTGKKEQRSVTGYKDDGGSTIYTDVGFSYNGGKTWLKDLHANMPSPPQSNATNWKDLGLSDLRHVPSEAKAPTPKKLSAGKDAEDAEKILANALGFTGDERLITVSTPMGTRTVWRENLMHMVEKRADERERYANYVLATLKNPFEIWLKKHEDGLLRENYVGLFQEGDKAMLAVVRINRDGSLLWNIMQRDERGMNRLREGWLVWKK